MLQTISVLLLFVFACAVSAQPVGQSIPAGSMAVVTNLQQLSWMLDTTPRVVAGVKLEVTICSAGPAHTGAIVVRDDSGTELLQLGPFSIPLRDGDRIRIEGDRCLLRRREMGVEITRTPVVDNDGTHPDKVESGKVYLTRGLHPFRLDYFNLYVFAGLELRCEMPSGEARSIDSFLKRSADRSAAGASNFVSGINVDFYQGSWLQVPDFAVLRKAKSVAVTNITSALPAGELFGIQFTGYFDAPVEGTYTFGVRSDDGSLLFLDSAAPAITVIHHESVPAVTSVALPAPMAGLHTRQWMSVEGIVSFVSRTGKGLQMELRSPPDFISVRLADAEGIDASKLLNSRIRVRGVGRAVLAPNQKPVLGELSVAASHDVDVLDQTKTPLAAEGSSLVALEAVGQVQSLRNEEASDRLPVQIHGVVTSVGPLRYRFISVQDETRGIFVRLPADMMTVPAAGQFCEIIGHTAAGDFAPIVAADQVILLGRGRLPVPARPTWNELINGSMDVQWTELQGLVTSVQSNSVSLLLPEGELRVRTEDFTESQLKAFEKSVVRMRGVLYAAWSTNRTVQVGNLMMRNANINVDVPAPTDPFDVPPKSSSELFQFDPRATAFQRVRLRGVAVYVEPGRVFMMDGARGIRILAGGNPNVKIGDAIEAVGYPDISGPAPVLREAVVRNTGKSVELKPIELGTGEFQREDIDSTLVRVEGKLLGLHLEQDFRVLEMSANGQLFLARVPTSAKIGFSLRPGSRLGLAGVLVGKSVAGGPAKKTSGFELLLSSPAQISVLSQPSWWTPQRLLIMVGLLLFVLILAAVWISQLQRLVEQRTEQLQCEIREREAAERERALEAERSRIARDLHDDLGASLTEIGVLANKGQRLQTVEDNVSGLFRTIAGKARGSVTALDGIVWAVDPEDNSLQSVADYLSDLAGDYLSHSGIACRFDIPVALPHTVLDGRLRHDLLLAVKETLNNIVRHANATEVKFRVAVTGNQLEIVISDNGKGFDAGSPQNGNGLKNLPHRLSSLGGRYEIDSKIGQGTKIKIALSISAESGTERYDV